MYKYELANAQIYNKYIAVLCSTTQNCDHICLAKPVLNKSLLLSAIPHVQYQLRAHYPFDYFLLVLYAFFSNDLHFLVCVKLVRANLVLADLMSANLAR